MCITCGCGSGDVHIEGKELTLEAGLQPAAQELAYRHAELSGLMQERLFAVRQAHAGGHEAAADVGAHRHADGTWHSHGHGGDNPHDEAAAGIGGALRAAHAPGIAPSRVLQIEQDILAKNDAIAGRNRQLFGDRGIFAVNLVSSPGSGKTAVLERTIREWSKRAPLAVVEGDQRTSRDADRVRAAGAPAVQINTAKGCHLDAQMVAQALAQLELPNDGLLLIENVGNLVCPAAFDLGEAHKVAILSVAEGDDKPLKYPDMFSAADLLLINKIDLLEHVEFDVAAAIGYARRARPEIEVILVSAKTGAGFVDWIAWLERGVAKSRAQREGSVEALRRRVAQLEGELAQRAASHSPA